MSERSPDKTIVIQAENIIGGKLNCKCGIPARQLTSRTEKNLDRVFFKCGYLDDANKQHCNFFRNTSLTDAARSEWGDEAFPEKYAPKAPQSLQSGPSTPTKPRPQPSRPGTLVATTGPPTGPTIRMGEQTPEQKEAARLHRLKMIRDSVVKEPETQRREREGPQRDQSTTFGVPREATPRKRSFDEPSRPGTSTMFGDDDIDLDRRSALGDPVRTSPGGYVVTVDGQGSPIKRQRTIVDTDDNPPITPRKAADSTSNQWDSIRNDPTHQFHSRSSALFGTRTPSRQASNNGFDAQEPDSPTSATRTAVHRTPSSASDATATHIQALKSASQYFEELEKRREASEKSAEVKMKHIEFLTASLEEEREKVRRLEKDLEDLKRNHQREIKGLHDALRLEQEASEHSRAGGFD